MPKFYFTGDICHPGKVSVVAENVNEAEFKLGNGEFTIFDEQGKNLTFDHNGDEPEVEDADG